MNVENLPFRENDVPALTAFRDGGFDLVGVITSGSLENACLAITPEGRSVDEATKSLKTEESKEEQERRPESHD